MTIASAYRDHLSRRFADYTAATRAMYCPVCGYTGTFKLIRGAWYHRPTKRDLQCTYSTTTERN